MNIPIVIAAYNRSDTLLRLLRSVAAAHYIQPVQLVISIDGEGPYEVRQIARNFEWKFGKKEVIEHQKNLGLKKHILSCGGISDHYDGIILLEDDLYVSPCFYQYALDALQFYKKDESICGVSLYSYQYNESANFPFRPLHDSSDVYFLQLPCSWGQAWTKDQWRNFQDWYDQDHECMANSDNLLPINIRSWPDSSWKKLFTKYMVENNLFFVYPKSSYTTNFGDKGQHHQGTNVFQVPIVSSNYSSPKLIGFSDSLLKYDTFCEILPTCLMRLCTKPLPESDITIDLFGTKPQDSLATEFVVTSKKCENHFASFGRQMLPAEMNIIEAIPGNSFFMTKAKNVMNSADTEKLIYERALDLEVQKYYFGTDDIHYTQLRRFQSIFQQLCGNDDDTDQLWDKLQKLQSGKKEAEDRLAALMASLSWRMTAPLRKALDLVKKL